MDYSYLLVPFLTWFVAGSLKFVINRVKFGKGAYKLIGYGGLPSNHSAIVTSMVTLIAVKEGIDQAAFGVSLTLGFIVILDASSLRRHVGNQSREINRLNISNDSYVQLRERIGHTPLEIFAGILVGISVGTVLGLLR